MIRLIISECVGTFFMLSTATINYGVKTPNACRRFIIILIFRLKRANSVEAIETLLLI